MATAARKAGIILVQVEQKQIVLTLSEQEASSLLLVSKYIGGNPNIGPRADMSAIGDALEREGIERSPIKPLDNSSMYFPM